MVDAPPKDAPLTSPRSCYRLVAASEEQLPTCIELTSKALGIGYPLEYASRGTVLMFLDPGGVTCGGAMIVLKPPFRSLESIPAEAAGQTDEALDFTSLAEINGVWLSQQTRTTYLSYCFWRLLLKSILATGRQQFLFTYAHGKGEMPAAYLLTKPRILFSGRTKRLPGMKAPAEETIAVVDSKTLADLLAVLDHHCADDSLSSVSGFLSAGA